MHICSKRFNFSFGVKRQVAGVYIEILENCERAKATTPEIQT